MKNILFIILTIVLITACNQKSINHKPANKKIKVFLFAGQSNMEGRADGDKLSKADLDALKKAGEKIDFYYNHKPVTPLQVTTPTNYVQKKFGLTHCFGPEIFFGINLTKKYPDDKFVFIKRSQGGTSLYGCWNPYWDIEKAKLMGEENKPKLFSDFIQYTKDVLSQFDTSEYEICGMLWVQGESDSGTKKHGKLPSETYEENLKNLIFEVRKQLNKPELPFVMFQVGGGKVVEGMKNIAKEDNKVSLIPQSNDKNSHDYYPKNPPPIGHYITESMKRIGIKFFETWENNYKCE